MAMQVLGHSLSASFFMKSTAICQAACMGQDGKQAGKLEGCGAGV